MSLHKYEGLEELSADIRAEIFLSCICTLIEFFAKRHNQAKADIEAMGEIKHSSFQYLLTARPGTQFKTVAKGISGTSMYPDDLLRPLRGIYDELYGVPLHQNEQELELENFPELEKCFDDIIRAKLADIKNKVQKL